MLDLGLRSKEALGLAWADVSLDRGVLVIRHALKREGGTLVLGEVKTARIDARSTSLGRLWNRSRRIELVKRRIGWRWGRRGRTSVLSSPPRSVPRSIPATSTERSSASANVPGSVDGTHTSSDTRSYRSCWRQGVPIEVVSDILGHSSIRMTADVYGHIFEPQRLAAAHAMGEALWGESVDDTESRSARASIRTARQQTSRTRQ